ncbi:MAG: peptidoglycan DD-metalloendopeptidase family protein [Actinobacteria bacterium]|nr:peptidoglycan DD-metalloendopeptidase family protein [Actinomycetota bacterium]
MITKSKNIIAVFVTIIIALSSFNLISTASPKFIYSQSYEDELEQIQEKLEDTQEKIKEVTKTETQYRAQVDEVEGQLRSALSELDNLNTKLSEAKSEVDKATIEMVLKEEELKRIEKELQEKIRILNDRVAAIYKNGNSNILEILLKAEDFLDFISKLKLMNLFAGQDTQNILEVKEKKTATIGIKKSIIDLREKQKEHEDKVGQLVEQAAQKAREVNGMYDEKRNLLSGTTANKKALMQMEKDLKVQEAEVTRILESYKYGSAPSGKFAWPVAGRIISGFGNRYHPIFGYIRFHSGIDIVASYGTPVKAADGGQVVQAGYFGGYGNSVMLYHGGGFATWYAHLSSINVSMGQFVQRGQVIGLIGSTGWTTGPHLHFEVRINGAPQDPRAYL